MKKIYYTDNDEKFLLALDKGDNPKPNPEEIKYSVLMGIVYVYGDLEYSYKLTELGNDFLSQRIGLPKWVEDHRIGGLVPEDIKYSNDTIHF
jgi:hypothetical protein